MGKDTSEDVMLIPLQQQLQGPVYLLAGLLISCLGKV
jgi:hypothetical protein